MAEIANVLRVVKAGKATKAALAAFDALNLLLKGIDLTPAAQIGPHVADLVDAYTDLLSRHADAKKLYLALSPCFVSSCTSLCLKRVRPQTLTSFSRCLPSASSSRAEMALRSLGYLTYNAAVVARLDGTHRRTLHGTKGGQLTRARATPQSRSRSAFWTSSWA